MSSASWSYPQTKQVPTVSVSPASHHAQTPKNVDISGTTGPLDVLHGTNVLVISDVENLDYGARDIGGSIHHDHLARKIRASSRRCSLHAFFSREAGQDAKLRYFENCGWTPHVRDIKTVRTHNGNRRLANSDPLILFYSGLLISRTSADVVVLASGDGDLVTEIADALKSLPRRRALMTLSLAGSTSARLNSRVNSAIAANIEIGHDCLERLRGNI